MRIRELQDSVASLTATVQRLQPLEPQVCNEASSFFDSCLLLSPSATTLGWLGLLNAS